jgi:hypothetical protein
MRQVSPVRVAAVAFIALAIVFGLGAFTLGFRAEGMPGPGLLPVLASVLLLPVGVRLLLTPGMVGESTPFGAGALLVLGLLALHALALPHLGFVVPTLALLVVWARCFHRRRLVPSVVLAVLITAAAALLFTGGLGVRMPLWPGES